MLPSGHGKLRVLSTFRHLALAVWIAHCMISSHTRLLHYCGTWTGTLVQKLLTAFFFFVLRKAHWRFTVPFLVCDKVWGTDEIKMQRILHKTGMRRRMIEGWEKYRAVTVCSPGPGRKIKISLLQNSFSSKESECRSLSLPACSTIYCCLQSKATVWWSWMWLCRCLGMTFLVHETVSSSDAN